MKSRGIKPYPDLTPELLQSAEAKVEQYSFYYKAEGEVHSLSYEPNDGGSDVKDPYNIWDMDVDGIGVRVTASIGYPQHLYGPGGICPSGGRLGIALSWAVTGLTSAGVSRPVSRSKEPSGEVVLTFDKYFEKGEVAGGLKLGLFAYLSESSPEIRPDEEVLNNDQGVELGFLDDMLTVSFQSNARKFPLEVVSAGLDEPLWWIDIYEWDDPRVDSFGPDHFVMKLNKSHKGCPAVTAKGVQNKEMLVEILGSAWALLFEKVRAMEDDEIWNNLRTNVELEEGSICSMLYELSKLDDNFNWGTPEQTARCVKRCVAKTFNRGEQ